MKSLSTFLLVGLTALVLALLAPVSLIPIGICIGAVVGVAHLSAKGYVFIARKGHTRAINTLPANVGSSKHSRRYKASAALATRYVFVKQGADDEHIAAIAATSDRPIGVITDEAAAAEDPIDVELSGINGRTLPCIAGAAIATLNLDVYTDAVGKVVIKPTAAGTYWKVGQNKTLAAAANDQVEVQLCEPRKLIVLAALTNTAGDIADTNSTAVNPTKADFDSLLTAAGKLQADFLLLAAALNSNADVAYATT